MKKRILFLTLIFITLNICAEAPELQKMLPTEWKYMNKYNGERTTQILEAVKNNRKTFALHFEGDAMYTVTNKYGGIEGEFRYCDIFGEYPKIEMQEEFKIHPSFNNYQLYEEKINGLTFYCYIEHESDEYPTNMYLMYLKDDKLIVYEPVFSEDGVYGTYLIPGKSGKIKAVCMSKNYVYKGKGKNCYIIYQTLEKDIVGYSGENERTYNYAILQTENFLYDKNDPLKYALIKAFDGDPSTSYVEDSKDDLLWIQFSDAYEIFFPKGFSEFKIINGYAKDKNWYLKNNRPKTIKTGRRGRHYDIPDKLCTESGASYELLDGTMEWQKCKFFLDQYFLVKDIYKGSMYKDTCIAELDFKYDGISTEELLAQGDKFVMPFKGWLFSSEPDE